MSVKRWPVISFVAGELGVGRWNRVDENIVDEINDRRWFEGNPFARYKASDSKAVLEARH